MLSQFLVTKADQHETGLVLVNFAFSSFILRQGIYILRQGVYKLRQGIYLVVFFDKWNQYGIGKGHENWFGSRSDFSGGFWII